MVALYVYLYNSECLLLSNDPFGPVRTTSSYFQSLQLECLLTRSISDSPSEFELIETTVFGDLKKFKQYVFSLFTDRGEIKAR